MTTQIHPSPAQIDRYRSGLASAEQAAQVESHLKSCTQCQLQLRFGSRLCADLALLPRLAGRLPARHRRTLRWPRVFGAGLATVSLAVAVFVTVPRLLAPAGVAGFPTAVSPQVADAVQNMDFYQWLSNHPQMLQGGLQNENPA